MGARYRALAGPRSRSVAAPIANREPQKSTAGGRKCSQLFSVEREGRKRAKERGVRFGRPRKMTPHQRQEALQRLIAGETQADVARTYAVDAATISLLAAASPFEQGAVGDLR